MSIFATASRRALSRDTVTTAAEIVGGACIVAGAGVLFGLGIALIVAGAALLLLGYLGGSE